MGPADREMLAELRRRGDAVSLRAAERFETYFRMDCEAAGYVESVIAMRTGFTGDPPYVGWKGLGLALNEALDGLTRERDEALLEGRRQMREWASQWARSLGAPDISNTIAKIPLTPDSTTPDLPAERGALQAALQAAAETIRK